VRNVLRVRLVLLLALSASFTCQAQIEVKELTTRPGVTIRFVYAKAVNPVASAVLFQGGTGNIGIFPNGSINRESFLSGGAHRFTQNGISVVIPDVPSDRNGLHDFRDTPEHAQDNLVLIEFLRKESKNPVWAIGTSNGSLSAAAASTHLKANGPDGIVLTSSVTKSPVSSAHPVTAAPLDEVKVPVLIIHHKYDGCTVSPYDAVPGLVAAFKSARKIELITVEGGTGGGACNAGSHTFLGIEDAVTKEIAEWIKRYQFIPAR